MMTLYQKKSAQVEARMVTPESADELAHWCGGMVVAELDPVTDASSPGINVPTLQGVKRASNGDYLVRNSLGSFEVYTGREFWTTFDVV